MLSTNPQYVAGWNIPGYLCDTDPETFDSEADAIAYLCDEHDRVGDMFAAYDLPIELSLFETSAFERSGVTPVIRIDFPSAEEFRNHLEDCGYSLLPNTGDRHDLGVAYWVDIAEDV